MSSLLLTGNSSGLVSIQAPAIAGSSVISLPTTSGTLVTSSSNNYYNYKNRIINGAMTVWQRGTSIALTATSQFTADRWYSANTTTNVTIAQSTDIPSGQGFQYSMKVQRTAANTGVNAKLAQVMESKNIYDLVGQSITLSFWAKAGANFTGAVTVLISTGTDVDQGTTVYIAGTWTGQTNVSSNVPSLTTTWTKYTYTATIGATAREIGIQFAWVPVGTAGADDSYYITGVQVEKDTAATTYDYRPYEIELEMCLRHLPSWNSPAWPQASTVAIPGYALSTTTSAIFIPLRVPVRAWPNGIYTTTPASYSLQNINTGTAVSGAPTAITAVTTTIGTQTFAIQVTTTAGSPTIALGNNVQLLPGATTSILLTGAEL